MVRIVIDVDGKETPEEGFLAVYEELVIQTGLCIDASTNQGEIRLYLTEKPFSMKAQLLELRCSRN